MNEPRKVLFVRFSAIGDVLLTTPILRIFHNHFPRAQIDFLVKEPFAPLIQHHPLIRAVHLLPYSPGPADLLRMAAILRQQEYDWVFDLQAHWQSRVLLLGVGGKRKRYRKYAFRRFLLVRFGLDLYQGVPHTVPERYFRVLGDLGCQWHPFPLELHIPQEILERIRQQWPFPRDKQVIAIAPGAGRATKRWPVDFFIRLIDLLGRKKDRVFLLLGSMADRPAGEIIAQNAAVKTVNWCGRTTLLETAAALKSCGLLITHDTGPMHMAAALKKEVVAIFGPTVRQFGFFPYGTAARVVEVADLSCRPCSYHGTDRCPRRHFRCMLDIEPERVCGAAEELLGGQ